MKKILLIAAALFVGAVSFAQETNLDANGNIQKGPYETNAFWDNWFIGIGGGIDFNYDNGQFGFTPALDFSAGKWIDPDFGVRAGYYGLKNIEPATGNKVNNNLLHADFLWNVSNFFWGYNSQRIFNLVPYFHADAWFGTNGAEIGAGFGLLAPIRLNEKLSIPIDLRGDIFRADQIGGSGPAGIISLTAGLAYNFDRTDWTRKSSTVAAYAAAVAAAEAAAAQAKADADAAKAAANAQQEKAAKEVEQVKEELAVAQNQANYDGLFDEPIIAYFQIGKSTLSTLEKEHVKYVAKNLIARGENVKFTLSGNADSKTGSAKRNQQLSEQRAAYVYKLMTEELGIDGSRFTVKANGGNDIFDSPELNRAVIIEKD